LVLNGLNVADRRELLLPTRTTGI